MPIQMAWDNPHKTVVRFTFTDHWSVDELYAAFANTRLMLDSVEHGVDAIFEMRTSYIPVNLITQLRYAAQCCPRRLNLLVVVSESMIINQMFNVFVRFYAIMAMKYKLVHSMDAAHALLNEARAAQPV
jgi:hypothetical protein